MPSVRDVIKAKLKSDAKFEERITFLRCKLVGVDYELSAEVSGRAGFVWARRYNDTYGMFQVFNGNRVPPIVGLPVLVEVRGKEINSYRIYGIDYALVDSDEYTGEPLPERHGSTHEWPYNTPEIDTVSVYTRALVPFRTFVNDGFILGIQAGRYTYNGNTYSFGGWYIDMSGFVPASGYTVRILLYYDPSTQNVGMEFSDTIADTETPDYVVVPTGVIPCSHVQLTGGMTELREAYITDARVIIHAPVISQDVMEMFNDLEKELAMHQVYGG